MKERQEGLVKRQRRSSEGWFSPVQPDNGVLQNKGRGKDQKGKGKEPTSPQSGFSASETPIAKKDIARPGNQMIGLPVIGLTIPGLQMLGGSAKAHTAWKVATPLNLVNHPAHVVLDLGCTRSIGSRSAVERFKKHA